MGKYLEERSKGKTTDAISALLALAPDSAVVKRNGVEVTVAAEDIQKGDIVVVRQGGKIPVDGVVVSGSGSVDESAITGESCVCTLLRCTTSGLKSSSSFLNLLFTSCDPNGRVNAINLLMFVGKYFFHGVSMFSG